MPLPETRHTSRISRISRVSRSAIATLRDRLPLAVALSLAASAALACDLKRQNADSTGISATNPPIGNAACDGGEADIRLPAGFCATIFADGVGTPRHIVAAPSGDVYAMLSGGGVLAMRDTNGDGRSDVRTAFGTRGNSGLYLRGTDLWADNGAVIVRYTLTPGQLLPAGAPDTIVQGLPTGGHSSRSVAVDAKGNLFIGVGSLSNICDGATSKDPCSELPTRAGVWRFDAHQQHQVFSAAARFATGIRNAVGMAIHPATGLLYVTQHGRDNLHQAFGQLFDAKDGAENPAEEIFQVNQGDDYGWPYCYYDSKTGKRVLGPEYGGDRSTVGRCATTKPTVTTFPGHWAPNGLVFYPGGNFPARYQNGAFVAFHGSWNRAPEPQAGYLIAFVPAQGTTLANSFEVFANGMQSAGRRPTGVAVDSTGSLFITDDAKGRIWKVVYRGK